MTEATQIMECSGAFFAAREIARHHVNRTKEIAANMHFLSEVDRTKLAAFIDYIVNRSR